MSTSTTEGRLRFDRGDGIATRILLWAVALGVWVHQLVVPLVTAVADKPLRVGAQPVDVDPGAAGAGEAVNPARADVLVADASVADHLLAVVPGVLVAGLVVVGTVLLTRLLRDLAAGDPFHPRNVRRLRVVAMAVITGAIVHAVVVGLITPWLLNRDGWTFTLPVPWVVGGLLVAAVAEAFATGTRLRSDVDGLV